MNEAAFLQAQKDKKIEIIQPEKEISFKDERADDFEIDVLRGTKISNAESSIFRIDKFGVRGKSLEREDFHWFAVFESLDGYGKIGDSGFSITQDASSVFVYSAHPGYVDFFKDFFITPSSPSLLNWNKNRKVRAMIMFSTGGNQTMYIGTGGIPIIINTSPHISFKVINSQLYGSVGNGTAEVTADLGITIEAGTTLFLRFDYYAKKKVDFYVNEVLKGTIDSGLPSGNYKANNMIDIGITTPDVNFKGIQVGEWDFWQAV